MQADPTKIMEILKKVIYAPPPKNIYVEARRIVRKLERRAGMPLGSWPSTINDYDRKNGRKLHVS